MSLGLDMYEQYPVAEDLNLLVLTHAKHVWLLKYKTQSCVSCDPRLKSRQGQISKIAQVCEEK
jgi:hypothetical protein